MKVIVKAGIAAAYGALIGAVGMGQSSWAQQQPPASTTTPQTTQPPAATTTPQTTPMQPGPGMGRQMMGRQMMQRGTESEGAGQGTSRQMMNMGQQMRTMGQKMMGRRANAQEQEHMGRQMMDMGQQMQNMGQQMMNEHGNMQTQPQGAAPAAPK